jgi:ATP-dependent Lon protease
MRRAVVAQFDQFVKLNKKIPPEVLSSIAGIEDAGRLADTIAAPAAQARAEAGSAGDGKHPRRIDRLLSQLEAEIDILQVEKRIRGRVKRQMEKSQREYYLNEQVKAIQKELGEGEEGADLEELDKKIKAAGMSKEGLAKAESELKKLRLMSPMSAEATVVRNFIETLIGLPWRKKTRISKDLHGRKVSTGSLRPGQGQGTHRRVPCRATARRQGQGADPVPGRPSGRRQDLARPVHCQGDEPQVRPHGAGWRA